MESCGMNTIKYLLFIFNFLFSVSGIAVIVVGAVVLVQSNNMKQFSDGGLLGAAIVLIVVGVIIFVVASMGCFGAIKESYGLLIAFAVALTLIFITELAVGIAGAVLKGEFGDVLKKILKESLQQYDNEDNKKAWDSIQDEWRCCGIESFSDWDAIVEDKNYPKSCCDNKEPCGEDNAYKDGCYDVMKTKLDSSSKVLIGVVLTIALIELSGVLLACCLASAIKQNK